MNPRNPEATSEHTPAVSILLWSHREKLLPQAFDSIFNQTFKDYELIIHFSKPWDATVFNRLMESAKGDYVLLFNDDDLLAPDFLEKSVKALDESKADICITDLIHFSAANGANSFKWGGIDRAAPWSIESLKVSTSPWISSLFRREVWLELEGWDTKQIFMDWDFWLRAFKAGKKATYIPEPLFWYRDHDGNMTREAHLRRGRELMNAKHPEVIV